MANTYTSLNYRLVFSEENRRPSLIESVSYLNKWVRRECRDQQSALADYERSPAIRRRLSVENEFFVA
jgi:hypothetical protein